MYLFRNIRFASAWVILMIAFAMSIVLNSVEYFASGYMPAFLIEKLPISRNSVWLTAFRFHVASSCICLIAGFPLFFPFLLKFRRLHFVLGYFYFNAVLWVAAPTGLFLSLFAKGGAVAAVGFAATGLVWWWTTWCGYTAIRRGDIQGHIRWMARSFSTALSAVFFRMIQIGLGWMSIDPETNYIASVWLSLFASVWLAENCIGSKWSAIHRPVISTNLDQVVSNS